MQKSSYKPWNAWVSQHFYYDLSCILNNPSHVKGHCSKILFYASLQVHARESIDHFDRFEGIY